MRTTRCIRQSLQADNANPVQKCFVNTSSPDAYRKSELECKFEESGRLTGEIAFMVAGDGRVVVDALSAGRLTRMSNVPDACMLRTQPNVNR